MKRIVLGLLLIAAAPEQRETDAYTRYELLAPATHSFRILYDITATTPGATAYFNPIRPGSIARDESVRDAATGKPLKFAEVGGDVARAEGLPRAKSEDKYIRVALAQPVPAGGGARIVIDKTYEDAASYRTEGDEIVFDRSLGIKRNAVVLPPGYELTACNVPSQVLQEPDGRIKISFWNAAPGSAPLVLRARRVGPLGTGATSVKLDERARQTRNIVYDLQQPETHSFALTHDYTETRPGVATYVNIVRAGSTVANPSARDLDTGAALATETLRGAAARFAAPDAKGIEDTTEAVIFRFAPVAAGQTRRIRIAETYTDAERYRLVGDELVWHRSFGRPDNIVVLPAGWALTNSSVPAVVTMTPGGRVSLRFVNPRTDEIDVIVTARRRPKV
ncbi:hypothetical protein [Glacieibacterium frigidum]|uniref:Uncharacterized protein n=1 Tax=Glacieibacterium frigidum TaxID=2593303 RepID=A0A552UH25_9SPHN|nr:hypothetical protein [Glacieibacterium frigidum]TRW17528.1 hypothetical protein FMM06_05080 [Glacieibacterium frigidum]